MYVTGDGKSENNETLSVVLSNPSANGTIATGTGSGTITDDDSQNGIWYVDDSATTGAGNGKNWDDAYTGMQAAITAASAAQEVWVAAGTYQPGLTAASTYTMKANVAVYGGFAGNETERAQRDLAANHYSILDGEIGATDIRILVTMVGNSTLDGFRLTHAAPSAAGDAAVKVNTPNGPVTVRNCTFYANSLGASGAASCVYYNYASGTDPFTLDSCAFITNTTAATHYGAVTLAGVQNEYATVQNCLFSGNKGNGQAIALATVSGDQGSPLLGPLVVNCTFANESGGYDIVLGAAGTSNYGSCRLRNCIFSSPNAGAPIKDRYGSYTQLRYQDICWQAGTEFDFIAYNNFYVPSPKTPVDEGGLSLIAADPLFVDADGADNQVGTLDDAAGLRIQPASVCVDAGTSYQAPATDFAGNNRVKRDNTGAPSSAPDLGAYEAAVNASMPIIENTGAAPLQSSSATLNGLLSRGSSATVTLYWGPADAGTAAGSWLHNRTLSGTLDSSAVLAEALASGDFSAGQPLYYRYKAVDGNGTDWSRGFATVFVVPGDYLAGMNMGFESAEVNQLEPPAWSCNAAGAIVGPASGVTPRTGSWMYQPTAKGNGNDCDHYQNFDLGAYAGAFQGSGGATFTMKGYYNVPAGSTDYEVRQFSLEFFDTNNTQVGYVNLPALGMPPAPSVYGVFLADNDPATWEALSLSGTVPATATHAQLYMKTHSYNASQGQAVNGFWDDFEFKLTSLAASVTVTITNDVLHPAARAMVNGDRVNANPYHLLSPPGDPVTLDAAFYDAGSGVGYKFNHWSDGLAQSHEVTPVVDTTYTVTWDTQYQWTWSANLPCATVTPASGSWYDLNATFDAVPSANSPLFQFTGWSGDYTGSADPLPVTMSGKKTVVATFAYAGTPPARIYVDDTATGIGDGSTWVNAMTSLQAALGFAQSGQEIWVAAGLYKPGSSVSSTFATKDGVNLYGGFAGGASGETALSQRDPLANRTILSGDISGNDNHATKQWDNRVDNAHHVVSVAHSVTIDGFVIVGGDEDGQTGGAGMFITAGSPVVTNCVFAHNVSHYSGTAMYVGGSGTPVVSRCVFNNNFKWGQTTDKGGGAIAVVSPASIAISDCVFAGNGDENAAPNGGGAIALRNGSSSIVNTLFAGNYTVYNGPGAAIAVINSGTVLDMVNCTISDNTTAGTGTGALNAGSGTGVTLKNTILWGNAGTSPADLAGTASATYSDITSGPSGTGNILPAQDPSFEAAVQSTWGSVGTFDPASRTTVLTASGTPNWTVNAYRGFLLNPDNAQKAQFYIVANDANSVTVLGDAQFYASAGETFVIRSYKLQGGSPCKDQATSSGAPAYDLRGVSRSADAGPDMGAYEGGGNIMTLNLGANAIVTFNGTAYSVSAVVPVSDGSYSATYSTPFSGDAAMRYVLGTWSLDGVVKPATTPLAVVIGGADRRLDVASKKQYKLTLDIVGSSYGSVGVTGGTFDNYWYDENAALSLDPSASSLCGFVGWTGDLGGNSDPASLTMDAAKSVTATFDAVGTVIRFQ